MFNIVLNLISDMCRWVGFAQLKDFVAVPMLLNVLISTQNTHIYKSKQTSVTAMALNGKLP